MEAYTERTSLINLGAAPTVPAFAASLEARLGMSRRLCAQPVPAEVMDRRRAQLRARGSKREPSLHPGRGRRHRREVVTRQLLDFLAETPVEGAELRDGRGRRVSFHALLHAPIPNAPRWALALRMQARALLDLAKRHGPASGWGIAQPLAPRDLVPKWTPYYIPRKSERAWRWWRQVALFLVNVLTTLARAWWRLIPLHRTRLEGTTAGERGEVLLASQPVEPSRCRDHSGGWETVAARIGARLLAM